VLNEQNKTSFINFKCSQEQLADIVYKLGLAINNIELSSDLTHLKL
jgi:hypothetical protein